MAVLKVRNSNGKASLGGAKDYLERDGRKICNSQRNFLIRPRVGNIIG